MGSEETHTDAPQAGSEPAGNVVRIPRDWFGPQDELVPFGPGAGDRVDERKAEAQSDAEVDPDAFWGENATSIHGWVEAPAAAAASDRRFSQWRRLITGRGLPTAAAAVLVVCGGVLGDLVLRGGEPHRSLPPVLASVANGQSATHIAGRPAVNPAARLVHHPFRQPHRTEVRIRHHSAQRTGPLPVVYHPSNTQAYQASYTSSPTSDSAAPVYSDTSTGEHSSSGGGSQASPAAAGGPTSQTAFGSSGALGPMSSPDG